jgi:hypothetical protein
MPIDCPKFVHHAVDFTPGHRQIANDARSITEKLVTRPEPGAHRPVRVAMADRRIASTS